MLNANANLNLNVNVNCVHSRYEILSLLAIISIGHLHLIVVVWIKRIVFYWPATSGQDLRWMRIRDR